MKKFVFIAVLGVMLCVSPFLMKSNKVANAVATEQVQVEENTWTKEDTKDILENFAVGVGGVLTGLGVFIPVYKKIKKAQNDLTTATTGIANERQENENFAKKLAKTENNLRKQENDFNEAIKNTKEMLEKMAKKLEEVEDICKLGFVNNKELVSKGVANLISKVGENEEHKE